MNCVFPGRCLSKTHGEDCFTEAMKGRPKEPCILCMRQTSGRTSQASGMLPLCFLCYIESTDEKIESAAAAWAD